MAMWFAAYFLVLSSAAEANSDLEICFSLNAATIRDQAVQNALKTACGKVIATKSGHRADRARAYLQRGLINLSQRKAREAFADCQSAIRLGQTSRQVVRCAANAKLALPARKKAEKLADKPQEATPPEEEVLSSKKCRALAEYVEARGAAGEIDRPIEIMDQLVDCQPNSATHRLNRGQYYLEQKNIDLALRDFDKCLETDKLEEDCRYLRGVARFRGENYKGAIEDLELVGPDYPYAKIQLDKARDAQRIKTPIAKPNTVDGPDDRKGQASPDQDIATGADKKIAMVIGMSRYRNAALGRLPNAERDAQEIAKKLSANGFRVTLLIDATKAMLENAIDDFAASSGNAEVAFIWYAGHGVRGRVDDLLWDSFLIPADFPENGEPPRNGIQLEVLLAALNGAKSLRVAAIDACRNVPALTERRAQIDLVSPTTRGVSGGIRGAAAPVFRSVATTRGFNVVKVGSLVSYSTTGGALALDGPPGGNSPFASAFLESFDADGGLDVRLFFSGVAGRTIALTNNRQTPENLDRLATAKQLSLK